MAIDAIGGDKPLTYQKPDKKRGWRAEEYIKNREKR